MNITLINTGRVIDSKGGTEKVFCDMANALHQRGHNVTAICCENRDGVPAFPLEDGVKFVNAWMEPTPLLLSKFARKLRSLNVSSQKRKERRIHLQCDLLKYKLSQILEKVETDVVVSFQVYTSYVVKKIIGESIPLVTMIHSFPSVYLPPELPVEIKRAVELSSAVNVLMPEFKDDLLKILPKANVMSIPNVVPQCLEQSDCIANTIINVARICPEKRQSMLVEAFHLISEEFPDWKLELWGESQVRTEYTKKLKTMIEEKGLKSRCILCGTTDDVFLQLKHAGIFAFPSEFEGFGLALTEAMSMGLPSIGCRNCPAVNTLIKDGENGLLCDATPESIAEALSKLMKDRDLRVRFGNSAKDDMKAFAPELVWDQWESLLYSLVNTKECR